jgi:hypothetical protein
MRLDTRDRDRAVELEEREGADRAHDVVEPEVSDLSGSIGDELDRSDLSGRRTGMGAVVEGVTDVVRPGCRREDGGADRSREERRRHQAAGVRPIWQPRPPRELRLSLLSAATRLSSVAS